MDLSTKSPASLRAKRIASAIASTFQQHNSRIGIRGALPFADLLRRTFNLPKSFGSFGPALASAVATFSIISLGFTLSACQGERIYDNTVSSVSTLSGNVIVTTVTTDPSTGPGVVSMIDQLTGQVSILADYFENSNFATGVAMLGAESIVAAVEGVDRLDRIDLRTGQTTTFAVHTGLSANVLRNTAVAGDGSVFVIEQNLNTIEKFSASGSRVGNPFINTTTGACVLSNPYGIAYIPGLERIAVINSNAAGRLLIYDLNGNCISSVTAAPFNANTPTAIAYHARSNSLLTTFVGSHAIWATTTAGASPVQIYLNSAIINTPRAIATDASGAIYVGSSGTDTVEKLSWSGSGLATRALPGPLAGPSVYTQNPLAIVVVP